MTDFTPGIASANAAGIKASRAPYPDGEAGVRLSLEEMARRIREGQSDPGVASKASEVLHAKGFNGRGSNAGTPRQRVGALLDFVRSWMLYAPDPPGTERISSAAAMLCLRPNLCVRTEDCDSLVVLLGSLVGSIGIPTMVLKQNYGAEHQQHVLLEAQDDDGSWFAADPSTDMPLGQKAHAVEEVRVDPLAQVGAAGTVGAEIVTLGAPRRMHYEVPTATFHNGRWWSLDGRQYYDGRAWRVGVGAVFGCEYSESKTFRMRLIGPWHALKEDVSVCAGLNPDQKAAFAFDFESFNSWYNNVPSNRLFCDDAEKADIQVGRDLEARLGEWRQILSRVSCKTSEPDLPPLTPDDPRNPAYDLEKRPTTASEIKNVAVTIGIIAAVGAGVYLAFPLLKAGVEVGADALRGRKKPARAR